MDYQPPMETKDFASAMSVVAVIFAATGPIKDIVTSVHAFTNRFAGTRVEGLPDDEGLSLRERLAQLDALKADGVITADEHAEQARPHPRRAVAHRSPSQQPIPSGTVLQMVLGGGRLP